MRRLIPALAIFLALTTTACGQSMKKPDIKLNPHPKMRYEVTLTIEDAPGPFDVIDGSSGYDVSNDRCVPLEPFSGARPTPEKSLPIALTRVSDRVYKGTLYVDHLKDEDYFGLGVCRWSLTSVGFGLRVGNLIFSHSLDLDEVLAGKSVPRYFNKHSFVSEYAKAKPDGHPLITSGNAHRSDFKEDSNNTFSTTLSAQEKFE
ncbi:hypothetical protein QTH89_17650 [Variovorax sp. J22G21]|uniref:hypothetical protein n=1 Tax=Variovorax fucosicus TaxID=3053517 RepID=UPI002578921C|nr:MULTISPECIES: hypothetical protein [unclassified Variovorax]MDM0038258.1 hypothetical protein [Variovorax sp. J22R193]MDM0063034.1 hypothetical protein [Variovorax sp. J22G21]